MNKKILIAVGGATGSGKTALALTLAKKYPDFVLLSADSRQIYKKLDVGTAKIGEAATDDSLTGHPVPVFCADGISQFLIDIAEPGTTYTLADYQQEAYRLMTAAWAQNKIPLLIGGTGLYLQAIIEGYDPQGAPDLTLREELEALPLDKLQQRLTQLGGNVAATDLKNKRRVIRAIERTMHAPHRSQKNPLSDESHVFVLERDWEEQSNLAPDMVQERLDLGLVTETQQLLASGIDRDWLKSMGLSYRLVIEMLDGELPESELKTRMIHAFRQLMRRQRTWFNRMPQGQKLSAKEIESAIDALLS